MLNRRGFVKNLFSGLVGLLGFGVASKAISSTETKRRFSCSSGKLVYLNKKLVPYAFTYNIEKGYVYYYELYNKNGTVANNGPHAELDNQLTYDGELLMKKAYGQVTVRRAQL